MYELFLSSNSNLSVSFKKDVAKIITELRKAGQLEITNEHIALKKEPIETIVYDDEPIVLANDRHIFNHQKRSDGQLQEFIDNKAYFDYLIHKDDLQHAAMMKDKDIVLVKIQCLDSIDKQIQLEEIKLQVKKQEHDTLELQFRMTKPKK